MTNIWTQTFEDIRRPHFEMEDPYTLSEKMAKKDWDGDGKIESEKDEVWGSRAKAAASAGKPFSKKKKVEEGVEGSAADEKADKAGMKKTGMTAKEWEASEEDKEADAKLAKKMKKEEYIDEAQAARENPEKYEREQSKKYAPVRGERTPMPPRGNKKREDFEKWYRANVKEETLVEVDKTQQAQKKIDVMKGKNKVIVGPQIKEEVEEWVSELVEEGYDLSEFTWEDMAEIYEAVELDEAEGSFGQTPKATAAYGALANKRRAKPASEYPQRGAKKAAVTRAERHTTRSQRTAADHGGKKSTKPAWHSSQRTGESGKGMTQKDRDHLRGQSEYGHVGYDPDGDGGPSGPGSKPKGKKLERQKKTGVSVESYDYMNEGTAGMPARGDAENVSVDTQSKKLARARIQKDMADVKYNRAVATNESYDSIVEYLSKRPDAFENLEEGVFDPKKSKMRPASQRSQNTMTDAQRTAAKKAAARTAEIHSKGETVLQGLRPQGQTGKVKTTPAAKPAAPAANRKVKGRYDRLAKAASSILKDVQSK